jgi:hypothetical protein
MPGSIVSGGLWAVCVKREPDQWMLAFAGMTL